MLDFRRSGYCYSGRAQYEDGLYFLDYELSYTITLASSRSMEPVEERVLSG